MPVWQLDPFIVERRDKCRGLVAQQGGDCEGSADMQNWVEYADAIEAFHRAAYDEQLRPRRALALADKLQICSLFVLAISKHPLVFLGIDREAEPVLAQAANMMPPEWQVVSLAEVLAGQLNPIASRRQATTHLLGLLAVERDLPARLAAAGCPVALTPKDIEQAARYRFVKSALQVVEEQADMGLPAPRQLLLEAAGHMTRLLELQPEWPRYLLLQAQVLISLGQRREVASCYRRALASAVEMKAHYWAGQACLELANALMLGWEGATFSAAEVRRLIEQSDERYRLARPWTGPDVLRTSLAQVQEARDDLAKQARRARPDQDLLPAMSINDMSEGAPLPELYGGDCAACGKRVSALRKCSVCKAVYYCSRECQKAHWKKHKRECAQLASQAAR